MEICFNLELSHFMVFHCFDQTRSSIDTTYIFSNRLLCMFFVCMYSAMYYIYMYMERYAVCFYIYHIFIYLYISNIFIYILISVKIQKCYTQTMRQETFLSFHIPAPKMPCFCLRRLQLMEEMELRLAHARWCLRT